MTQQIPEQKNILKMTILGLVPLALLGIIFYSFFVRGTDKIFMTEMPPVEKIDVLRHTLKKDLILLDVISTGTDPVALAQVMVRGAFWQHNVTPRRVLKPLESAQVTIPYPWNFGEPVEIILLTSTGLTFDYEIEVATATPRLSVAAVLNFAMLGVFVGLIPVGLGICWFPFLRRLSKRGISFCLYFTTGLLVFLTLDSLFEGFEIAESLPEVFQSGPLLVLGLLGAFLVLMGIDARARTGRTTPEAVGFSAAWLIAFGIGLHNLAEGLAIGSAYVLGELTLGAILLVGFTIHNTTEGIAVVSPILDKKVHLRTLAGLGLLAGAPTILGCWIGAFTYSPIWSIFFLGIGAGALIQVVYVIIGRKPFAQTLQPLNILGMLLGYLLMYATGLLVGSA